jgi:hypothetical protein
MTNTPSALGFLFPCRKYELPCLVSSLFKAVSISARCLTKLEALTFPRRRLPWLIQLSFSKLNLSRSSFPAFLILIPSFSLFAFLVFFDVHF